MTSSQDPATEPVGSRPEPAWGGQGGGAGYGAPPAGPARNGLGTAALVLGVLALLTGWFFVGAVLGIVAVVLGVLGRGRAKRGEATNGGMALAGIVLGVLGILLTVAVIAGLATFLGSDTGQRLQDCLQRAGQDTAAQQQCQTELQEQVDR